MYYLLFKKAQKLLGKMFGLAFIIFFLLTSSAYASVNFVNITTGTSASSHSWTALTGTPDATILYATAGIGTSGPNNDSIWKSTDAGLTWTEISGTILPDDEKWYTISTTEDGTKIVAGSSPTGGSTGNLWLSTDSGATWNDITTGTIAENYGYSAVHIFSDGSKILGGTTGGAVFVSSDDGVSWTEALSATGWAVTSLSADSSGAVALATEIGTGDVWVSTDGGDTWTDKTNGVAPGGSLLSSSAVTSDGAALYVVGGYAFENGDVGDVWVSTNNGDNWTNLTTGTDAHNLSYSSMSISSDGSTILLGVNGGTQDIWLSTDSGATWTNVTTGTDASGGNWLGVKASSDGGKLFAIDNASDIWAYTYPTPPTLTTQAESALTSTAVTLNGTITDEGNASSTDRGFYYGLTTSYGSVASTTGTFGEESFTESLTGLTPNTTYHYQAFAINSAGTGTSSDATFTTDEQTTTTSSRGRSGSRRKAVPLSLTTTPPPSTPPSTPPPTPSPTPGCTPPNLFNPQTGQPCTTTTPTFTRDLYLNIQGDDVKLLQIYLNTHGYPISQTGPGSLNNETTFFGPLTQQALIRFQLANHITPAVGYFGAVTRGVVSQ